MKEDKPMNNLPLAFAEYLHETMTKANEGDKQALFFLAKMYEEGLYDSQPDLKEALKWYRKLALQGDRSAQRKVKEIEIQLMF
jgi:TPR repeat protein